MLVILLSVLLFIAGFAVSWAITVGMLYLICLCFSLKFSILIATGIWLVLCLLWWLFNSK